MAKLDCKKYEAEVAYWSERHVRLEQEKERDPGGSFVRRRNPITGDLDESIDTQLKLATQTLENARQNLAACRKGKLK